MKRSASSPANRDTNTGYYPIHTGMVQMQMKTKAIIGKDTEQLEPLDIYSRNINSYIHYA